MMNRLRSLETFARTGWLARGVVYCLLAYIALTSAGASEASPQGVFRSVRDMPSGSVLLVLLAMGLALYGAYHIYGAALDSEGKGSDAKGVASRLGYAASGIAHFLLAWAAVRLASGNPDGGGGREKEAAGMLLDIPLGPVGRADLAARAVVFAVIGYSLIRAGWFGTAGEVKGLGDALSALTEHAVFYTLVAAGLFLFGIHSLVEARRRCLRDEDVVAHFRAAAR